MNIYYVPMLISGILCILLAIITWLLRRGENINRVFSLFALALALDSFSYLVWFHFGSIENITTWIRVIFPIGILVPITLILFFFAFTGYDKRLDEKVLGIKVGHFRIFILLVFFVAMVLSIFTQWMIKIPETPKDIWDLAMGPYGMMIMFVFAIAFFYMLVMAYKSYRRSDNKPRRRFIILVALGTLMWVLIGYSGIIMISATSLLSQAYNYIGIVVMVIIYFVALINYQSDKVHALNLTLEGKVEQLKKEITERKHAEEVARQQQEKLIQADKMASVGILVSGVAHEINNPNNFMLLNSNNIAEVWQELQPFLEKYIEDNDEFMLSGMPYTEVRDEVALMIQGISDGSERIRKIVQTLKDFARKDAGNLDQIVDINKVIGDSETILSNLIKKSTDRFTRKCQDNLPKIKGNFQQLEQVLINLISNSCQALDSRDKEVTVSTEFNADSNSVVVTVRDDGTGIAPENMKHVMDPFFTTKRDTGGTGLGLSISYKIVNDHKGELTFESEPGKGTTATIVLPVSE